MPPKKKTPSKKPVPTPKPLEKPSSSPGLVIFPIIIIAIIVIVLVMFAAQNNKAEILEKEIATLKTEIKTEILDVESKVNDIEAEKLAEEEAEKAEEERLASINTYKSSLHGFSVEYPIGYKVDQIETKTNETLQETVILIRKSDQEKYQDTMEGGPSVYLEVLSNPDGLSVDEWAKENQQYSNFDENVDDQEFKTVGGMRAFVYSNQGLGGFDYYLFEYGENIFLGSVNYYEEDDTIRLDMLKILDSLELE